MLLTLIGLVGLLVGSFLNVVAHRVPAGRSVVRPGSTCPACGIPILARDQIPVVSWLLLRGRCRRCHAPISPRYPFVEAATAVLFVATALVVGFGWLLPAHLWFVALTFVLAVIDLDTKRLPNRVLYPGTVVGLALLGGGALIESDGGALVRGVLGGLAYFAGLFVVAVVARGGFGFGDVKLGFLLGLFTAYRSWGVLAVGVFAAFVLGGLVSILLLALRRAGRKDTIPFGPAMVVGSWIAVVAGEDLAAWYFG